MASSARHSRHNSRNTNHSIAISTSSAIRSSSPSPVASPSSPTPNSDGLSRRLSWNRSREDTNLFLSQPPVTSGLATPSRTHLLDPRTEERDIVYVTSGNDIWGGTHPLQSTEDLNTPIEDIPLSPPRNRNFGSKQYESETSLGSNSGSDIESFNEDRERLTPGQTYDHPSHSSPGQKKRSPLSNGSSPGKKKRPYDEKGLARSSTLRKVSKTIRSASVRVVNIMGVDRKENDGVERLGSEDDEEDTKQKGRENIGLGIRIPDVGATTTQRPDPRPPEIGLRGRTLGVFSKNSRTRKAMNNLMKYPYTEPAILILIITNVVVLAIQSAPAQNEPRIDDGYFQSWEDYVLLGLFCIFTLEMFARIVVSGLLLDPDRSLRDFLLSPSGIIPTVQRRVGRAQNNLQRNLSKSKTSHRAAWRFHNDPTNGSSRTHRHNGGPSISISKIKEEPKRVIPILPEAPFQSAVAKQKNLALQGRPYLRHSWHRIDMIAVIAYWITFFLAISGYEATANRHVYIFRALSVLRAGRLLVITSGTTTILHSLKRAGPMLITVAYFLIFAAGIFSIIGVQSFKGSFRRFCVLTDPNNSTNEIILENQCGGSLDPITLQHVAYLNLDGSRSTISPKGYICPLGQVCKTTDDNPNNGVNSFDNIFQSLVQVIIICSINTWAPVMYSAMDSDFFSSAFYFLAGVIVLNFWLLNLLVAVVVNTFSDIRAETKRSAFGGDEGLLGTDPQWAAETKQRKMHNKVLTIYQRTEIFWVLLILTDMVTQGTKTASSSASMLDLLKNLEIAFTLAFDVEMIIRITGHFPDWRSFFLSGRNCFDLFLAVACSIIQIPVIANGGIYQWLTVFQLLRWYRVILAFPRMKPLLNTFFGSFAGLLNMVVFLFLMIFLSALMALQLFRGDIEGDPIDFSQTFNAFLGMYQISSSENWTDVLYNVMGSEGQFAQNWLSAIFLCGWMLFSFFILVQLFIAVINENFAVAEEQKRKQQVEAFIRRAEPQSAHISWIDRLNPYRLMSARHNAVKVGTLPPNLVLPLRQNIGADVGSVPNSDGAWGNTAGAKGAMRRLLGRDKEESPIPLRNLRRHTTPKFEDLDDDLDDDRGLTDLLPPLNAGPSSDEHMDALRERRNQQADFIAAHPSFDQSLWIFRQNNPIRRFCQACVQPAYGDRIFGRPAHPILQLVVKAIVFSAVVASIVIAAVASPAYRRKYYGQHGYIRGTWFDLTEVALGTVFIAEAGIKIIADGFMFAPNAYLLSLWNVLDFIILITLLINTTTSLIFIGGLSRMTRALKSFRALRLITLFSRLRDTLHAVLFAGALKILDASILMVLYLIPFAVWGLNIFSGLLYYCNDDSVSGKSTCVNEYASSSINDSITYLVPRVWANPALDASKWSFDSFRESILILFESVSLEGWIDVMASLMNIVGRDEQPQNMASQWNAIFMLIFNLFGGVIILTLFVSIIIQNFSTRSGNALLTTEQRQWVDLSKFIKAQTPSQLPKGRPTLPFRAWCYDRATTKDGFWAVSFTWIYYLHILLLMMQDFSENILNEVQLDIIFLCLTVLYAIDLLIRFYGLGLRSFRANGWNLFDVVVIAGSFATTIPALQAASAGLPGNQVNIQLQKLFLVSISLKLVQRISSLNQLFKTSVASLPAIGNLFLLWATLFIWFAIMYLEVFGLTKMGNNAGTRFQNYYSFGNALIMLAFMSTGEGWNGYMHDYTISPPRCTENSNFLESDCGSAPGAYALFISWNIVSMYIFLNMFTGVVVESFAYVYQMPGGSSLNREEMRAFKRLWAEFDTQRTGYIKRKDFVRFFSRLTGVFEVRTYPVEYSLPNMIRNALPDPIDNASGKLFVANGVRRAVDIRRLEAQIAHIDYRQVRERRLLFSRLYSEAKISEENGRGISFTSMLMMLAHYKLIDDEKALQLDDLLVRRAKTERVTDLVNLGRVRGLLRTIYWRRRFLASRDERRRTLNAEAEGIPAIVLEPMPATPPLDEIDRNPFHNLPGELRETTPSPPQSRMSSPTPSPEVLSTGTHSHPLSPDVSFNNNASMSRHSPALSVSSTTGNRPTHQSRPSLGRQTSNGSMLSSEDAHYRRESPTEEFIADDYFDSMATSVWGDMMREAVDKEET
ncbi:high-affinity cell membrane calcium channel [Kwoniella mangroviensis CBS 10435]|uniref:Calcium-channel protein CCH1 n=1 Tax=Kwoniella mangroviensis CBS 10435 TaxID=1331196 RepID=A0A1B9IHJ0_9TREE|nr:high-affinity cell membrane calcium channel [Kwoniella mangroviensis CBS 10435]